LTSFIGVVFIGVARGMGAGAMVGSGVTAMGGPIISGEWEQEVQAEQVPQPPHWQPEPP
jgi:hypothetical protein